MGPLRDLFSRSSPGTIEVLAARLENAPAIVAAAGRADVPVSVAAALAELESGGRNVFGRDRGGVFATPGAPPVAVTRERVAELRRRVAAGETSNGVGPAQITWPPFFDRADAEGLDLAEPEDNLTLGLRILHEHAAGDLSTDGIERAGTLYNAGTLAGGVTGYGRRLARATRQWAGRLGEPGPEGGAPPGPSPRATGPSGHDGAAAPLAGRAREHVIEPGDTLWAVARAHGTDVATLRELNPDLVPEALAIGTRVRLP